MVDNDSQDGSPEMVKSEFPTVKLIESQENLGFARGNNLGIEQATGTLLLFLNSDAFVKGDALEKMVAVFSDDAIVAAGPKLLNMDGSLQESVATRLTLSKVFMEQSFLDLIARRFGKGYWRTRSVQSESLSVVHQVMGACIMVRARANEIFDERFFLYCEDTELCFRLEKHGKIVYVRDAEVLHELGSSSADSRWKAVARYNLGKELYFWIHGGKYAASACYVLDRSGAFIRLIAGLVISPFLRTGREKVSIFYKVLKARNEDIIPLGHTLR